MRFILRVLRLWVIMSLQFVAHQTNLIGYWYNICCRDFVEQFKASLFDAQPQIVRVKILPVGGGGNKHPQQQQQFKEKKSVSIASL